MLARTSSGRFELEKKSTASSPTSSVSAASGKGEKSTISTHQ